MSHLRKKPMDDDDDDAYFNDDASTEQGFSKRGPAAVGISRLRQEPLKAAMAAVPSAGGEVDPLDAFMAGINAEVSRTSAPSAAAKKQEKMKASQAWEENYEDDPIASYYSACEKGKAKKMPFHGSLGPQQSHDRDEEDEDRRNKPIEPLPRVDHTQIKYNMVQMDFYKPHDDIAALDSEDVQSLRGELAISATGSNVACPVPSFALLAHALGKELMAGIRANGYQTPTAIQAQTIPIALGGRDVIGIAETGSGKTAAYLLPLLVHTAAQPALQKDEGPISIVLCPTHELAVQIETEVYKFNKRLGLRSVTLAGGLSKLEQFKEIKRGCEIVVGNPGRVIDIVKMKGCNFRRTTFLVIDEADRMMQLGFEYQVRSIVQAIRPARQTLFFSATFPPKIERLARDLLSGPVRVTVGEEGQAASSVKQTCLVMKDDQEKWGWLAKNMDAMLGKGQVLIFVKSIATAEELTQNFKDFLEKSCVTLHGDMEQGERMKILKKVRNQKVDVLIATDVAARGLDITTIRTVVSFDVAKDIETHTHRIGRTGRAGAEGEAFTLLTNWKEDSKMAAFLVESFESSNQPIDDELQALAMKHGPYRNAKLAGRTFDGRKKKNEGTGGKSVLSKFGLGFDGKALQKEAPKDLEARLNQQADAMVRLNRQIMAGSGGGRKSLAIGVPVAGFVSQTMTEEKIEIERPAELDKSDSDDDLFAPGVSAAFGKAPPKAEPKDDKSSQKNYGSWNDKDASQSWTGGSWSTQDSRSWGTQSWQDQDSSSSWPSQAASNSSNAENSEGLSRQSQQAVAGNSNSTPQNASLQNGTPAASQGRSNERRYERSRSRDRSSSPRAQKRVRMSKWS